jgi:hypothetical protein
MTRTRPRFRAEAVATFPPELDEAWYGMLAGYGAGIIREARYLSWRYARHPVLDYQIRVAERDGKTAGYIVWRPAPAHVEEKRAVITDFLVEKGDAGAFEYLVSCVVLESNDAGAEVLSVLTTQSWAAGALRKFGFLPRGNAHAWVVAGWEDHISPWWVTDAEPWHMCLGDSDGDMWTGSV